MIKKPFFKDIVLVVLIIVNLGLILLAVLIFPAIQKSTNEFNSLYNQSEELKKAKVTLNDFDEAKIKEEEKKFKQVPFDQESPLKATKVIMEIARNLEIPKIDATFLKSQIETEGVFAGITTFNIEAKLSCPYEKLRKFLKEITKSDLLMNVRHLKITRNEESLPELDIVLGIDSYTILTHSSKTN